MKGGLEAASCTCPNTLYRPTFGKQPQHVFVVQPPAPFG